MTSKVRDSILSGTPLRWCHGGRWKGPEGPRLATQKEEFPVYMLESRRDETLQSSFDLLYEPVTNYIPSCHWSCFRFEVGFIREGRKDET